MQETGRHGTALADDLVEAAREWAADDPDPETRAELEALVTAVEGGVLRCDGAGPTFRVGASKG